ncbi:UDP-2,3-diacylglucosamine diphosphatase LpxI [Candidatus Puniceispirillum sp.]|nr:UDP-2,3-diacylglucosamine diphosphatase LpxI [Candidatus Puniceispirillum sp.]
MTQLAIIAGKGQLPVEVAAAASADGHNVLVLPIEGQADADFTCYHSIPIRLGAVSETRSTLAKNNICQLVMVGKVDWPSMTALRPDFDGIKLLGKMITKGDDSVLRTLASYFAELGIETIAPDRFLPHRRMPFGVVTGKAASAEENESVSLAVSVLEALGGYDVGQSIVVQNSRVIAIEGAEGTDSMILRSAELCDPDGGVPCLVKMSKNAQDLRLDMPVIGCNTVLVAARSGISFLAVEEGSVLMADNLVSIQKTCTDYHITLVGIRRKGR